MYGEKGVYDLFGKEPCLVTLSHRGDLDWVGGYIVATRLNFLHVSCDLLCVCVCVCVGGGGGGGHACVSKEKCVRPTRHYQTSTTKQRKILGAAKHEHTANLSPNHSVAILTL